MFEQLRQTAGLRPASFGAAYAAARGLRLEHAPAVVAGVDAQIRFFEHEPDIVASDLLASAAPEACASRGDAFAHASGQPVAYQEPVQRRRRFRASLVIDEPVQIEVAADIALGGHRDGCVLEVFGEPEQLGAVPPRDEPRERLAELVRASCQRRPSWSGTPI